jgi:hypothetical protein
MTDLFKVVLIINPSEDIKFLVYITTINDRIDMPFISMSNS